MPKRVTELTVKEIDAAKPGKTLTVSKGLQLVVVTCSPFALPIKS
jgi:hypothetical protein